MYKWFRINKISSIKLGVTVLFRTKLKIKQIFRKNSVSLMQKTGILLEDNEYLYGIILKGRYSTVMDDAAYRAHQGMTANGEHTPRILPWMTRQMEAQQGSTDGRYLVSCIFPAWFVLHVLIKMEYFSDDKFQSLGTARIHLNGWPSKGSTPSTLWWTMHNPRCTGK